MNVVRVGDKATVVRFSSGDGEPYRCSEPGNQSGEYVRSDFWLLETAKALRLQAAILAALPYIETPHVRATLQRALDETK